jgi:hypothetical protein
MTRKDLINFSIMKKWANARIRFLEEQIETVGRLNSVLSDMPKGSRRVQDAEAESLTKLLDQIKELEDQIKRETVELENRLKEQLSLLESKYGLLLYHHYILGDSIKYIAEKILYNETKYTYKLRDKALEEFDKLGVKR